MRLAALAGALATIVAAGACDTRVRGIALGPLDANPSCEAARDPANHTLPWIQTNILDKRCAFSGCHQDVDDQSADLKLTDGDSYTQLVDADAKAMVAKGTTGPNGSPWKRVVPGDPANSYLMVVLDPLENPNSPMLSDPMGFAGPIDKNIGSMPASSGELLCSVQRDAIKDWIAKGAPEQ